MRIAHVTDLHYGQHNTGLADSLQQALKKIGPDLLVATGDLADSPSHLAAARGYIDLLGQCCRPGAGSPPVLAIPGNHDYRLSGWLWKQKSLDYAATFGDLPTQHFFADQRIWVYGFDSASAKALGTGQVTDEALEQFYHAFEQLRSNVDGFHREIFKVVLLHHHPLPVNGNHDWRQRSLMMVDAGRFLGAMLDCRVNLVLHGHEHKQGSSRFQSSLGGGGRHEMSVVSLGSTLRDSPRGKENWFNLITVDPDDGDVKLQTFSTTSNGLAFEDEPVEELEPRSRAEARRHAFAAAVSKHRFSYREAVCIARINQDGDCLRVVELHDLRNQQGSARSAGHELQLPLSSGYIQLVTAAPLAGEHSLPGIRFVPADPVRPPVTGRIDFGRDVAAQPVSYSYQWWSLNAFALDAVQFVDKYGPDPTPIEYVHLPVNEPIEELTFIVQFPPELTPAGPPTARVTKIDPAVDNRMWKRVTAIEQDLASRAAVRYTQSLGIAGLRVSMPKLGHYYGLEWPVRQASRVEDPAVNRVRNRVLQSRQPGIGRKKLAEVVYQLGVAARELLLPDWPAPTEHSLMLFDPVTRKLHTLGAVEVAKDSRTELAHLMNISFNYGEGIAGRVLKDNKWRLYQHRVVTGQPPGRTPSYYLELSNHPPEEILLACPLQSPRVGLESHCYGVFNMGSRDPGCPLGLAAEASGGVTPDRLSQFQDFLNQTCLPLLNAAVPE
jgi:3',5'-cyclic AMP phosphodiesterase CpdA